MIITQSSKEPKAAFDVNYLKKERNWAYSRVVAHGFLRFSKSFLRFHRIFHDFEWDKPFVSFISMLYWLYVSMKEVFQPFSPRTSKGGMT